MTRLLLIVLAVTVAGCERQDAQTRSSQMESQSAPLRYSASGLPDRIVLTPGANPAVAMAVSWRTDTRQTDAELQLAPALAGPSLAGGAVTLRGSSQVLTTDNGTANYHQVRIGTLQPDRAYVYRVRGADDWSEWLPFRTASEGFRPFRFIYFGDVQNDILALASRTIRQAFHATANPALVVHAGDLVAQRDEKPHDDEWGEWNQAGGHHYAMIPQLPAAGNHEYVDRVAADGSESRRLGPHWPLQFALPDNGAVDTGTTSYYIDYQGVRFIVLDGTAALDLGALDSQTRWLEQTLADSTAQWQIVVGHQPIFTCARPNDTEELKAAWQSVFDRYKVDLVLQGHDHCYSRLSHADGYNASIEARRSGAIQGPVYLVSVAGSKMYRLNDRAAWQPDRVAEETQLYQTIEVEARHLRVRSWTASGELYDAFDIERGTDGGNRLLEPALVLAPLRTCGDNGPDGVPCTARAK